MGNLWKNFQKWFRPSPKELTPEDYAAAIKPAKYPLFAQEDASMKKFREAQENIEKHKRLNKQHKPEYTVSPHRTPNPYVDTVTPLIITAAIIDSSSSSCDSGSSSGGSCE